MKILKDKTFDSISRIFEYSFREVNWNYDKLTKIERLCLTREEFNKLKELFRP